MNQEVTPGDILFGAIILIMFLVCAFIAGRLLSAWKNRRFTAAWVPLVPLIKGTVHNDGGGAATSWLTGTYRGKQVQASMVPEGQRPPLDISSYICQKQGGIL